MTIGKGKRSICPALSEALRNAFLTDPNVVCASHWLIDLVVDLINATSNMKDLEFSLETALAKAFDELAPGRCVKCAPVVMLFF
jgi:hypothetical protein